MPPLRGRKSGGTRNFNDRFDPILSASPPRLFEKVPLVGGKINFEAGEATARGGNIELGGLSAAGTVGINDDGSLNFPENVERADVQLTNDASVNVRAGGGGFITVNADNVELSEGSNLLAGIKLVVCQLINEKLISYD